MKAVLFLTSELAGLSLDIYKRVQTEAKRRNVPLICYCGNSFHNAHGDFTPESKIYDYINKDLIKGVILNGGAMGQFSPSRYLNDFVTQFTPLPVVSLSFPIESATNILVDNYKGIYNLIDHLVKEHSYKKICFVKGPEGHPEAEERYKAYLDALKDNNLPLDDNLVAPGDFSEEAGIEGVKKFLSSGEKPDAIACVDDDSALGVYSELKRRDIKIPSEVAVCGFDDIDTARNLIPSLTTVAQPYGMMIEEAFNEIEQQNKVDKTIPTLGIFRESCGCRDKDILAAESSNTSISLFSETRDRILNSDIDLSDEWKIKLLDALESDISEKTNYRFIDELSVLIEEIDNINKLHYILSVIISNGPLNERSRTIFHQARLLINKISNRMYSLDKINFQETTSRVNKLMSDITQVDSYTELTDLLTQNLPLFKTNSCQIALYSHKKDSVRLFYSLENRSDRDTLKEEFDPKILIPKSKVNISNETNLLVAPLIANGEMIGYIVYSLSSDNTGIFGTLTSQISGEIARLNLQQQREEEKQQLEERNRSIQNLITPMLDSIKKVAIDSQNEIDEMKLIKQAVGESNENLNRTVDMLNEISIKINAVMESVTTINDISENVNVLAINTSIQSAHAGEFGRAFGVIAKEIRKLSDSTAINAKTITEELSATIKEFKNFTDINKTNVDTFKGFTNQVNHFMDIFKNIAEQMESLSDNSLNIIDIMES